MGRTYLFTAHLGTLGLQEHFHVLTGDETITISVEVEEGLLELFEFRFALRDSNKKAYKARDKFGHESK